VSPLAVEFVDLVLRGAFELDPTAKLILVCIAERANINSGGVAWPSVTTLARECGIGTRQIKHQLHGLIVAAWIEPVGSTVGGRGQPTHYKLNLRRMAEAKTKDEARRTLLLPRMGDASRTVSDQEMVKPSAEKGELQRAMGVVQRTERVKPTAPEPEVEPESKPEVEPSHPVANANRSDNQSMDLKPLIRKLKCEPEGSTRGMSREEQLAWIAGKAPPSKA
jgi:hypothetical protein